jgi:hypothetical protein
MSWSTPPPLRDVLDGCLRKFLDELRATNKPLDVGVRELKRRVREEEPDASWEELAAALWRWNAGVSGGGSPGFGASQTYEALRRYQPEFAFPFGALEEAASALGAVPAEVLVPLWLPKPAEHSSRWWAAEGRKRQAVAAAAPYFVRLSPLRSPDEQGTPAAIAEARAAPALEAARAASAARAAQEVRLRKDRASASRAQAAAERQRAWDAARATVQSAEDGVKHQAVVARALAVETGHVIRETAELAARATKRIAVLTAKETQVAAKLAANEAEMSVATVAESTKSVVDSATRAVEAAQCA